MIESPFLFLRLLCFGQALFLYAILPFPYLSAVDDLADGLHAQEVYLAEELVRACLEFIQFALGVDKSSHIKVQSDRVCTVYVTLAEVKDQFEQLRTDLELQAHQVGQFLTGREVRTLRQL